MTEQSFDPTTGPEVFIQWKNTDVCFDFYCECGAQGHFDGLFAYAVRCDDCGRAWNLPHTLHLGAYPWEPEDRPETMVIDIPTDGSWR